MSLDGSEQLPAPEETTAGRIVAAGGSARASSVSVTDEAGVRAAVRRPGRRVRRARRGGQRRRHHPADRASPRAARTTGAACSSVHLDGYRNVLGAALPIMAAAGRGHILGVTSGSGWRPADAGAYGCAKRAVASLTWQLGRQAPPGVVVNAMSPIAVTRMVTAALGRTRADDRRERRPAGSRSGSMPTPEQLGPLGAHLVSDAFASCHGQVLFAGGSEVAVIDEPRLLEVVRTDDVPVAGPRARGRHHRCAGAGRGGQASGGGSNAALRAALRRAAGLTTLPPAAVRSCAVVADRPRWRRRSTAGLEARAVRATVARRRSRLRGAADTGGTGDRSTPCVVAATGAARRPPAAAGWERVLAEHAGIVDADPRRRRWARAVADHAAGSRRPVRLVTLTDATTAGGRSRAQAVGQLARAGRRPPAIGSRPSPSASRSPTRRRAVGELAAHLAVQPRGAPRCRAPSWSSGAGLVRAAQPPAPDRQHHLRRARRARRGSTTRSERSSASRDDR